MVTRKPHRTTYSGKKNPGYPGATTPQKTCPESSLAWETREAGHPERRSGETVRTLEVLKLRTPQNQSSRPDPAHAQPEA
jgi:hypothetical protein